MPDWFDWAQALQGLTYTWYWSESEARTDIPNEVRAESVDNLDPTTRTITDSRIRSTLTALKYTFGDLKDEVDSNGFALTLPIARGTWDLELSGGYDYVRKTRFFEQVTFGLGSTSA